MAVQRVRRVIRKIDPWTVLKVSSVFNGVMAVVFVLGSIVFWAIFVNAGIPERINELALLIGLENGLNLDGAVYFRIVLLLALIGTIFLTGFMTLGAVIYNLITDIVGGIEVLVLEDSTPVIPKTRTAMPLAASKAGKGRSLIPSLSRTAPAPLKRNPLGGDETVIDGTKTDAAPPKKDAAPRGSVGKRGDAEPNP